MSDAIQAYRSITADEEFRHMELLREMAELDEANAMSVAEERGEKRADEKWQGVVAEKDAENKRLMKENAELRARLNENQ